MKYSSLINALLDPPINNATRKKYYKNSTSQPLCIYAKETAICTDQEIEHLVPDYEQMHNYNLTELAVHKSSINGQEKEDFVIPDESSSLSDLEDYDLTDESEIICFLHNRKFTYAKEETIFSEMQNNEANESYSKETHSTETVFKTESNVCSRKIETSTYDASLEKFCDMYHNNLHEVNTPENLDSLSKMVCIQNIEEITNQLLEELIVVVLQQLPAEGQMQNYRINEGEKNEIKITKSNTMHCDCSLSTLKKCAITEIYDEKNGLSKRLPQNNPNHCSPLKCDNADTTQSVDITYNHMSITDIMPDVGGLLNDLVSKVSATIPNTYYSTNTSVVNNCFQVHEDTTDIDNKATSRDVNFRYLPEPNSHEHCQEENEICKITESLTSNVLDILEDSSKDTFHYPSNAKNSKVTNFKLSCPTVQSNLKINFKHSEHVKNGRSNTTVTFINKSLYFVAYKKTHSDVTLQDKGNQIHSNVTQESTVHTVCTEKNEDFNKFCHSHDIENEVKMYRTDPFGSLTAACKEPQHSFSKQSVENTGEINASFREATSETKKFCDGGAKDIHPVAYNHEKIMSLECISKICSDLLPATHQFADECDETSSNLLIHQAQKDVKTGSSDANAAKEMYMKNIVLSSVALNASDDNSSPVSSRNSSLFTSPSMKKSCGGSSITSFLYPSPDILTSPSVPSTTEEKAKIDNQTLCMALVNYSLSSSLCHTNDGESDVSYGYEGDLSNDSLNEPFCLRSTHSSQDSLDAYIDEAVDKYSGAFEKRRKYANVQAHTKENQSYNLFLKSVRNYTKKPTCKRSIQHEFLDAPTAKRAKLQLNKIVQKMSSDSVADKNFSEEEIHTVNVLKKVPGISVCKQDVTESTQKEINSVISDNSAAQVARENKCEKCDGSNIPQHEIHQNQQVFCNLLQHDSSKYDPYEEKFDNISECWETVPGHDDCTYNKKHDLENWLGNLTEITTVDTEDVNMSETLIKDIQLKQMNFEHLNPKQDITALLDTIQINGKDLETKHPNMNVVKKLLSHDHPAVTAQTCAFNWKTETSIKPELSGACCSNVLTGFAKTSIRVGMSKRAKVTPLHARKIH